jgi:DNA-binding transcriptional ArsR family regulator
LNIGRDHLLRDREPQAGLEKATKRLHIIGMSMDAVFRALADPIRRGLLDSLYARNGQGLNELCEGQTITRQAVTKHLAILEEANLVATLKRGREKLHYLNLVPIHEIADRWIGQYERGRLQALGDVKRNLEGKTDEW